MSPETKARISAALKKAHAERAKKGVSWKSATAKPVGAATRHKKAGASTKANPGIPKLNVDGVIKLLEQQVRDRQQVIDILRRGL